MADPAAACEVGAAQRRGVQKGVWPRGVKEQKTRRKNTKAAEELREGAANRCERTAGLQAEERER